MVQPPRRVAVGRDQPTNVKYKATLDTFMLFIHGQEYHRDQEYTVEERDALSPNDVVHWMNFKTFWIEEPPVDANHPVATCQLGGHSICKFAATHTQICGCTRDEKDIRGQWKSCKHVSDVYDNV